MKLHKVKIFASYRCPNLVIDWYCDSNRKICATWSFIITSLFCWICAENDGNNWCTDLCFRLCGWGIGNFFLVFLDFLCSFDISIVSSWHLAIPRLDFFLSNYVLSFLQSDLKSCENVESILEGYLLNFTWTLHRCDVQKFLVLVPEKSFFSRASC